ncbi:MAG TPA: tryptophanase [Thermoanaerobaculia bacterium]|nr:tryptophanase [Thermoanaerobaculia bacterium]
MAPSRILFEPFRIKSVEPIRITSREERAGILDRASWNLFKVRSEDVLIDLFTDSGTGAMSDGQWAALQRGDEAYAGSRSWFRFEARVRELTGLPQILPTHQGRAAERILFSCLGVAGKRVINNTHFDTTRANIEALGGIAVDLAIPEARQPGLDHPFKGNMDLGRLEQLLGQSSADRATPPVAAVMLTVTNNSGGGQPASLANLRATSQLCHRYGVPFFLDACRFAENAFFIKLREPGQADRTVESIANEMFSLADGATFSAKKDGLANIGGFLGLTDEHLAQRCKELLLLTEGFPTYGGLAGRDLEAIAVGLTEVVDENYLRHRIETTRLFGRGLAAAGLPIIEPPGGHAIYVDAGNLLPHIPAHELPGQALACALYLEGGVRSVEIGTLMFGGLDPTTGKERFAPLELVRLALPRRVYTRSHLDYVIEVAAEVAAKRFEISGLRIVEQADSLRHFTARLEPITGDDSREMMQWEPEAVRA